MHSTPEALHSPLPPAGEGLGERAGAGDTNPAAARFTLLDPAPAAVAFGFALTALLTLALRALG